MNFDRYQSLYFLYFILKQDVFVTYSVCHVGGLAMWRLGTRGGYTLYSVFIVFQTIRIDYYKRLSTKLLSIGNYTSSYRTLVPLIYGRPRDLNDPLDLSRSITWLWSWRIVLLMPCIQALGYTLARVRNTIPLLARLP